MSIHWVSVTLFPYACLRFRFYYLNEDMGLLGSLGIVVDENNLEEVRNDFTDTAGVHDQPLVLCCD